jgi:hypothetical protein
MPTSRREVLIGAAGALAAVTATGARAQPAPSAQDERNNASHPGPTIRTRDGTTIYADLLAFMQAT